MIKNIFFDLDGTLLPMDQDKFTKGYFSRLVKRVAPLGYEPQRLIDSVWRGTAAMVKNTGHRTNEDAFWQEFQKFTEIREPRTSLFSTTFTKQISAM